MMVLQCKNNNQVATAQSAPFPDVTTDMWGVDQIAQAQSDGIISGYPDGTFGPDKNVIRAEASKIIELADHVMTEISSSDVSVLSVFKDVDPNAWYGGFVAYGVVNHYFAGYMDASGNLTGDWGPANNLTRAEAAKIIANVFGLSTTSTL